MFELRYLPGTVTLEYDRNKCNGCQRCVEVCPHAVFAMRDKLAEITDYDACMECGACALNCETTAITVQSGVGCAAGIINGYIKGTEPTCGCDDSSSGCC